MINIHLYPSNFSCETRIEKQARSIHKLNIFNNIILIGLVGTGNGLQRWKVEDGIEVRLVGRQNKRTGFIRKICSILAYYIDVLKFVRGKEVRCINAHSLSVLPLCVFLSKQSGAKLIYDTHELETETNSTGGIRKVLGKITENFFIRSTDHIFVVGEKIAQWYENAYSIKKPTVILNAPYRQNYKRHEYFRTKFNLKADQIICLYLGSLSDGRGIRQLCEAFVTYPDDKIIIIFMGDGPLKEYVLGYERISKNIYFHSPVSTTDVVKFSSSADVGLSLVENTCLSYYYSMPNKVFEYLFASLPIVVSNMKETADFVRKYRIGRVLPNVDPASIRLAILAATSLSRKSNDIKIAIESVCWERQEDKMLDVYNDLMRGIRE